MFCLILDDVMNISIGLSTLLGRLSTFSSAHWRGSIWPWKGGGVERGNTNKKNCLSFYTPISCMQSTLAICVIPEIKCTISDILYNSTWSFSYCMIVNQSMICNLIITHLCNQGTKMKNNFSFVSTTYTTMMVHWHLFHSMNSYLLYFSQCLKVNMPYPSYKIPSTKIACRTRIASN